MINNILFLAYEIWFYLLLIWVLIYYYYYCIIPGFSRMQLKNWKYVVDHGILWKWEVALGQQKSVQACLILYNMTSEPSCTIHGNKHLSYEINLLQHMIETFMLWKSTGKKRSMPKSTVFQNISSWKKLSKHVALCNEW
jgi:hypothetical protein